MTPESSEAPREDATGIPVEDREAFIAGNASVLLKDNAFFQREARAGQVADRAELVVLASKYQDVSAKNWPEGSADVAKFLHDVRRLAAAVLSQEPAQ